MSIGEKLKTIANRMRSVYSGGYTKGHSNGYEFGYDTGVIDGGISARENCLMTHYAVSVLGNGTRRLEIPVPFSPDLIMVFSTNPYTRGVPNTYKSLMLDTRSCCRHAAYFQYCDSSGTQMQSYLTTRKYFSYQDGVWSFEMRSDLLPDVLWRENVRYTMIAVKFEEENAEDLVREQIMLLPATPPEDSSGILTYSESAVNMHFTPQQWQELTALKPNWNFVLQ